MPEILFVCTANICRSPMAVGLFKAKLAERGMAEGWEVSSAGTWGANGLPAAQEAVEVMAVRGIDIGSHRSRVVSSDMVKSADLILTMEKGHKEALQVEFPEKKGQIFLLTEMVGQSQDFADPIGKPLEAFEQAADDLERILEKGFVEILNRAREGGKTNL